MPSTFRPSVCARLSAAVFVVGLLSGPAWAGDYLLGEADSLAIDQPRITFGLSDESDPNNPLLIGPTLQNLALLDTGANGILLGQLSFVDGEDYNQPLYNGVPAMYNEQGVAGFEQLDVYSPYALRLIDSAGTEFIADDNVIAFGGDDINLGSFAAIVGMPAMVGRVVDIDLRPMLGLEFQGVNFHDTISQVGFESAASLNVELRMLAPEHTDTTLPPEMRPTFAPLPLIDNIQLDHATGALGGGQNLSTSNTYLMDTGAQTTIISEAMAASLGLDLTQFVTSGGDVVDVLEVGGIGGTTIMPLVVVEELRLPTTDGVDLVYTNVLTGVLDIEGTPFDAVLGMNILTSGYTNAIFGGGTGGGLTNPAYTKDDVEDFIDFGIVTSTEELFDLQIVTIEQEDYDLLVELGLITNPDDPLQVYCDLMVIEDQTGTGANGAFYDRIVFDFTATDGTGIMRLDLNALHEEGDANLDDFVGAEDLDIILAHWGQSVRAGSVLEGDLTGDGLVNQADLDVVLANFGNGTPPGSVPEPAAAVLLLAGLAAVTRRRRSPLAA
ncbi:MAG: aspartyl protease family protein [Phycisphaerales bacterium JB063]